MKRAMKHKLRKPTRWDIANLLNCLQWVCWADVVDWEMKMKRPSERRRLIRTSRDGDTYGLLWMNGTRDCRADAARTGTCYCGKFATAEAKIQCGLDGSILVEPNEAS